MRQLYGGGQGNSIFGQSMEIFMGSVLAGDNAATPSPYDFANGRLASDISMIAFICYLF